MVCGWFVVEYRRFQVSKLGCGGMFVGRGLLIEAVEELMTKMGS